MGIAVGRISWPEDTCRRCGCDLNGNERRIRKERRPTGYCKECWQFRSRENASYESRKTTGSTPEIRWPVSDRQIRKLSPGDRPLFSAEWIRERHNEWLADMWRAVEEATNGTSVLQSE